MREIGFVVPTKNEKYQKWVSDKVLRKTQTFSSRVKSIVRVGREPVYDTTQPNRNTVIFNGLVTGQCGEQPLPAYGCCCLGSINLTPFVSQPFTPKAGFDFESFAKVTKVAVRMLDDALDATVWPLSQQKQEADDKRRLGLRFSVPRDAPLIFGPPQPTRGPP